MRAAVGVLAAGGNQNFLGARWVAPMVRHTPPRLQQNVALKLLALSPHYFYAEREARQIAIEDLGLNWSMTCWRRTSNPECE